MISSLASVEIFVQCPPKKCAQLSRCADPAACRCCPCHHTELASCSRPTACRPVGPVGQLP